MIERREGGWEESEVWGEKRRGKVGESRRRWEKSLLTLKVMVFT